MLLNDQQETDSLLLFDGHLKAHIYPLIAFRF
jgi:hypothetical protein